MRRETSIRRRGEVYMVGEGRGPVHGKGNVRYLRGTKDWELAPLCLHLLRLGPAAPDRPPCPTDIVIAVHSVSASFLPQLDFRTVYLFFYSKFLQSVLFSFTGDVSTSRRDR